MTILSAIIFVAIIISCIAMGAKKLIKDDGQKTNHTATDTNGDVQGELGQSVD